MTEITIDQLADGSLIIYDGSPPEESAGSYKVAQVAQVAESGETGDEILVYAVRGITKAEAFVMAMMWASNNDNYE